MSGEDLKGTLEEEDLVRAAQAGSLEAQDKLLSKYKKYVKNKAKIYFMAGADSDDVIQEGMIGLFKAIRDYNQEQCGSFKRFAGICITRQMLTAIKSATRKKHIPLNSYVSINQTNATTGEDNPLIHVADKNKHANPEEVMLYKEELGVVESKANSVLSKFEWRVLEGLSAGNSYQEISMQLNKSPKSIDNAIQRIKKKLNVIF